MEVISGSIDDLPAVTKQIFDFAGDKKIWLFFGDMGAGKTTLIKNICQQLGTIDVVSSPSFSLVNEYRIQNGDKIFHFDFYRIKSEEEAMDIGVDEYFQSNDFCLIEWPEKIPSLIPDEYLSVNISVNSNNKRIITLTHHG